MRSEQSEVGSQKTRKDVVDNRKRTRARYSEETGSVNFEMSDFPLGAIIHGREGPKKFERCDPERLEGSLQLFVNC